MPDNPSPLKTSTPAAGSNVPAEKPRRTRRRWWVLLFLTAAAALLLSPRPWQAVLRSFLTLRAERQGWELQIGAMEGGLFDATELYNVRCTQRSAEAASQPTAVGATDFRIERVELTIAWRWPWLQSSADSWVRRVTLEGVHGTCDFTRVPAAGPYPVISQVLLNEGWRPAARALFRRAIQRCGHSLARQLARLDPALLPENLDIRGEALTIERGRYHLLAHDMRLELLQGEVGHFALRGLDASGPQFASKLQNITGWTYWKGSSLEFGDVDLGRGVRLASATLSGEHLDGRRLEWDGELKALGGRARGQGAVVFSQPRLSLEIAGSLEKMAVAPLAKLLGVTEETGGQVQQANFTFRGDPENWAAAQMWLATEATDFRWGARRWESLELRGMVIDRRVQVYRLELRQNRNQLSFTGECALPTFGENGAASATLNAASLWQAGFSCNIDARVDDLHALAQLAGGELPDLSGRMSVNGTLATRPGAPGIDGYLNVEGSTLSIRGAPLESLRTTLLFHGTELNIPDLEATRGGDYFRAQGTMQINGPARYKAELHAAVQDLSVYAPAYADLAVSPRPISGALTLDWSGDGVPGANSGAFQGTLEHFFTTGGPAALGRPVDLAADGTYSPESVSFRHLVLKERSGGQQRDAAKLEGALPWTRDPRAFAAGRWLDPDRPMALRIECAQAPLDLLARLAPGLVTSAAGQISGWLNANGTLRSPKLEADLQLEHASFQPADASPPLEDVEARLKLEKSVLHFAQAKARWGTQIFELGGDMDLTDTAHIRLDLTVQGNDVAGIHDQALDAGLSYDLTLRGPLGGGTVLGGEVKLLAGRYEQPLIIGYAEFPGLADLAPRLPFALREARLDLHVTAIPALRVAAGGPEAWIAPDLRLTGTLPAPRVSGELTAHQVALSAPCGWHGKGDGVWFFSADEPGNPTVSVSAVAPDGAEVFFYGTAAGGQKVSWPGAEADQIPVQWKAPGAMAAFGQP